ncbi:MAG: acyl carrier protein [Desulfobacteraceae bacterium]|nr:acyl carrier protein [Desulfobacteraceae bacterium]
MDRSQVYQIQQTVVAIFARLAETTPDKIGPQDRFIGDLGFDSLKSMEALARITDAFGIEPDIERMLKMQTVGEVIEQLVKHLS